VLTSLGAKREVFVSRMASSAASVPSHHSRFHAARRLYLQGILGLYEHNPFLNRLLIETGRSIVFFNILALYAAYDPYDRATWPTISLLKETIRPFGVASARRIHDIVARLVETDYVQPIASPSDRRARMLTPTGKMLAHDLDWLAAFYAPLQLMFPEPGYGPPIRRHPAYQKAHRKVALSMSVYAIGLMSNNPGMLLFMNREAGTMILMKLVQDIDKGLEDTPRRSFFADVAKSFGISRTHVRITLQDAQAIGLIRMTQLSIVMMPPLIAAFERFVADVLAGHDFMFRAAMRELPGCAILA
jgi:hypothetical protein